MDIGTVVQIADAELVEAARNGDIESLGKLCCRHYVRMVGVAYCILSDRHLAEDAAQEALAVVCRHFSHLKSPEKFSKWVTTICRNKARRMAKSKAVPVGREVPKDVPAPPCENPRVELERRELLELVRRMVWQLPVSQREVVVLFYYIKLSYAEIAETLGISEKAVDGRLARAKKRIAERLERDGRRRRTP